MKVRNYSGSKRKLGAILVLLLAGGLATNGWAVLTTVDEFSTADTAINGGYYPDEITNYGTWGAVVIGNGNTDAVPVYGRGLFSFDLSAIPADAVVLSATLHLAFTGNNGGTSTTLSLYRMTTSWTQLGATWFTTDGSTSWNAAGAASDHSVTPSAYVYGAFVGSNSTRSDYTFTAPLLVSDVQGWINGSLANDGWILINSDEADGTDSSTVPEKQVFTTEFPASSYSPLNGYSETDVNGGSPYLDITYETVPEPGIMFLLVIGFACIAAWRRATSRCS